MKEILNYLFAHNKLTKEQAKQVVLEIGEGKHNPSQIASFLTVFAMRSITIEELEGFRDAMLDLCLRVDLSEFNAIDIVGTGGDGKDTFNISTLASFVTAGSGYKVAKHGNYGVSSGCGSSNVLEHLGVQFSNNETELKQMINDAGFCMMHAPLFHPAMKHVGPIRKEMQVRTFFNMLGPILNPAFVKNQLLGVFNLGLGRLYGYLHQQTDKNFAIVHALDGYDEVSLTGKTKLMDNEGEKLLSPSDFGFRTLGQEELQGGNTVESSAEIFLNVLDNKGTEAQEAAVVANASLAIKVLEQNTISILEAKEKAVESLRSGSARKVLTTLTGK